MNLLLLPHKRLGGAPLLAPRPPRGDRDAPCSELPLFFSGSGPITVTRPAHARTLGSNMPATAPPPRGGICEQSFGKPVSWFLEGIRVAETPAPPSVLPSSTLRIPGTPPWGGLKASALGTWFGGWLLIKRCGRPGFRSSPCTRRCQDGRTATRNRSAVPSWPS